MKIEDIKLLAENRLSYLNNQRSTAINNGEMDLAFSLDVEIEETENTLRKLRTLGV